MQAVPLLTVDQQVDQQPRRMVGKVVEFAPEAVEAAAMKNLPEGILFNGLRAALGSSGFSGWSYFFIKCAGQYSPAIEADQCPITR